MNSIEIAVPRINDESIDFRTMGRIWKSVASAPDNSQVVFDLSNCDFLRPNAIVFLGGLTRMIARRGGNVAFKTSHMPSRVRVALIQCGFAQAMGFYGQSGHAKSIPYREDGTADKEAIVEYLTSRWLRSSWVHVSVGLKEAIVGQMWEIYANAFEHALSPIGVFSCGQHFPTKRELELVVADFGVGMPFNARTATLTPFSGKDAMEWAFRRGTSSAPNTEISRGIGLDLLKEFVKVNNGQLEVYSHDGYARIDQRDELYEDSRAGFEATVMVIKLRCDERYYRLSSEPESGPYF